MTATRTRVRGRLLRAVLALAAAGLLLAGCGRPSAAPRATAPAGLPATVAFDSRLIAGEGSIPAEGEAAPDFSYTLASGATAKLSDLRGRKAVVNFWATWCGPCKEEMPDLQRLATEYGDRLAVLGVNKLETADAIGPFVKDMGITFTVVANPEGDISERYGAKNLPMSYFVNSDGSIGAVHIGVMTYDEAKVLIERLK